MDRYYDDFALGDGFDTDGLTVTESMILDFAMQYDPQPFHLDVDAAARSPFGGLIASGAQTLAIAFRLFLALRVLRACSLGSPGVDLVRFTKPVRPGDTLTVRAEILEATPSRSKPDRGVLRIGYVVNNQRSETVLTAQVLHLVSRQR